MRSGSSSPTDPGSSLETARAFLRRETERWHRAVEATFAPLDLTSRTDFGRFLQAQAAAVLPVEAELDAEGVIALLPDWPRRRRSDALRADLASLDLDLPDHPRNELNFGTAPRQLGALYVLEGSRLGGRMLARRIAASEDPAVRRASAFLRHDVGPGAWPGFLAILDRADACRDDLLEGAITVFAKFGGFPDVDDGGVSKSSGRGDLFPPSRHGTHDT